jgi:chromodomain-helicase-DNA-binding protein 4
MQWIFISPILTTSSERIVQVGKKKLVLDHLIVQKMDDDDEAGDNVQSILTFGAQALFEADAGARDIICEILSPPALSTFSLTA